MYTLEDYERDLRISRSLGIKTDIKDFREVVIFNTYNTYDLQYSNVLKDGRLTQYKPKGTGETEKDASKNKISAVNFQYLKRSKFNRNKFKSTLKSEKSKGKEDDFAGLFLELWTQFEYEYRKRLYENFIPNDLKSVLKVLKMTNQNKNSCLEEVVQNKSEVTFGLVNEVIYAIEKGFSIADKGIAWRLSKVFNSNHLSFFKKYNINHRFARLNSQIRNMIMHENMFLDYDGYKEVCNKLFNRHNLNEWCNYENPCFFTEYLKMLPESEEEKHIADLEVMIRKIKMGIGLHPENEQINNLEEELNERKTNLIRI